MTRRRTGYDEFDAEDTESRNERRTGRQTSSRHDKSDTEYDGSDADSYRSHVDRDDDRPDAYSSDTLQYGSSTYTRRPSDEDERRDERRYPRSSSPSNERYGREDSRRGWQAPGQVDEHDEPSYPSRTNAKVRSPRNTDGYDDLSSSSSPSMSRTKSSSRTSRTSGRGAFDMSDERQQSSPRRGNQPDDQGMEDEW